MLQGKPEEAAPAPGQCAVGRLAGEQGGAVGKAERLVEAPDGDVARAADRLAAVRREPRLGGVLDEQQAALVAPAAPAGGVLREAQVVHEMKRARAFRQQRLELVVVGRERARRLVEAGGETGTLEGLDLGPVVEGRSSAR
jgi:hypothetical protein